MYYFAYGSNLNARAVRDWAKHHGHRAPPMKHGKSAVLDNFLSRHKRSVPRDGDLSGGWEVSGKCEFQC